MSIQVNDRVVLVQSGKVGEVREIRESEAPAPSFALVALRDGGSEFVAVNALKLASDAAEELGVAGELARLEAENTQLRARIRQLESELDSRA